MPTPMCSSILNSFFWYDANSFGDRFSPANTTYSLLRNPRHAVPWVSGTNTWGASQTSDAITVLCTSQPNIYLIDRFLRVFHLVQAPLW